VGSAAAALLPSPELAVADGKSISRKLYPLSQSSATR
jgi:hypothetical protein